MKAKWCGNGQDFRISECIGDAYVSVGFKFQIELGLEFVGLKDFPEGERLCVCKKFQTQLWKPRFQQGLQFFKGKFVEILDGTMFCDLSRILLQFSSASKLLIIIVHRPKLQWAGLHNHTSVRHRR